MGDSASKVAIVGAGGIGCALGHSLCAGGIEALFVDTDTDKLAWGRHNGVAVDDGDPRPAEFIHLDDWRPSPGDVVLLCTKCYDNRAVIERIPDAVELVPVQNGFDAELVDRVAVEGIASFVTECLPGMTHTRITRPGELHIGFREADDDRRMSSSIDELIDVLEAHGAFTVRRVPEVLPYKNTKLMYNAAISPLASMAGLDNGELLTIAPARRLFFALIRENYRILKSCDAPLARIGPFHPDTVDRLLRLPLLARMVAIPFARSLHGSYCSMAGDLGRGPTELDNYNGHLLELAGELEVPLNRAVYELVKRMETERLIPERGRLDELRAALAKS
jgi:2-dehydropantoate 2-reductase